MKTIYKGLPQWEGPFQFPVSIQDDLSACRNIPNTSTSGQ